MVASLRSADLEAAEQMAAEADGLLRRAGVPMGVAHNLEGRGIIAFERGELNEAASLLTEAIRRSCHMAISAAPPMPSRLRPW